MSESTVKKETSDNKNESIIQETTMPVKQRNNDTILIFFGSQSGTAEFYARNLAATITKHYHNAKVEVVDLLDFEPETITVTHRFGVFFLASYGSGEPTDNAISFMDWLVMQQPKIPSESKSLDGFQYAMLGFGNSQYPNFNGMANRTELLLDNLGAVQLCEAGGCDDDGDTQEDYNLWVDEVFFPMLSTCTDIAGSSSWSGGSAATIEGAGSGVPDAEYSSMESVAFNVKDSDHCSTSEQLLPTFSYAVMDTEEWQKQETPVNLKGTCSRARFFLSAAPATISSFRICGNLENGRNAIATIKLPQPKDSRSPAVVYPGATLDLLPATHPDMLESILKLLIPTSEKVDHHKILHFWTPQGNMFPFPPGQTIKKTLEMYLDFTAPATCIWASQFFSECLGYQKDSAMLQMLLNRVFSTKSLSANTYHNTFSPLVLEFDLTIYELITVVSMCLTTPLAVPLGAFLKSIPKKKPRSLTVADCTSGNLEAEVVFSFYSKERTMFSVDAWRRFLISENVCQKDRPIFSAEPDINSLYVGRLTDHLFRQFESPMPCVLKDSALSKYCRSPAFAESPALWIANGTGIAPFKGFLSKRSEMCKNVDGSNTTVGAKQWPKTALFYGVRTLDDSEFLYKGDLIVSVGKAISQLVLAVSREPVKKRDAEFCGGMPTKTDENEILLPTMHVQEQLMRHENILANIITNGYIIICGSIEMGNGVLKVLKQLWRKFDPELDVDRYVSNLLATNRLITELWEE